MLKKSHDTPFPFTEYPISTLLTNLHICSDVDSQPRLFHANLQQFRRPMSVSQHSGTPPGSPILTQWISQTVLTFGESRSSISLLQTSTTHPKLIVSFKI